MPGDHFAAMSDHHFMHIPLHQHLTMPVLGGNGVVVGAIAHQRQRADPRRDRFTGLVWSRGKRQHRRTVALEALADRLRVPAQTPLAALAALRSKMRVQLLPAIYTCVQNHESPPGLTDQLLRTTVYMPLAC